MGWVVFSGRKDTGAKDILCHFARPQSIINQQFMRETPVKSLDMLGWLTIKCGCEGHEIDVARLQATLCSCSRISRA